MDSQPSTAWLWLWSGGEGLLQNLINQLYHAQYAQEEDEAQPMEMNLSSRK